MFFDGNYNKKKLKNNHILKCSSHLFKLTQGPQRPQCAGSHLPLAGRVRYGTNLFLLQPPAHSHFHDFFILISDKDAENLSPSILSFISKAGELDTLPTSGEGEAVRLTEAGLEARLEDAATPSAVASASSLGLFNRGRPIEHQRYLYLLPVFRIRIWFRIQIWIRNPDPGSQKQM